MHSYTALQLRTLPTGKCDLSSLDFVINRFFVKMFNTSSIDIVKSCQLHFNFDMPSILWAKRARTFDIKFSASDNMFCKATAPSHAHSL